jgi:LysM repeat protein
MKRISLFIGCLFVAFFCNAQNLTPIQYVEQYKDIAIKEMKRMGIPAAITLAQGILESESGNSDLVKKSNNHFGIKCKNTWTAGGVSHDDDAIGECFRVYKTAEESYRDHSNFLKNNSRYSKLFSLDITDYKGWAYGLKAAGYATNPRYPEIVISNIEKYNLQQYTLAAAADVAKFDATKYEDDKEEKVVEQINDAKTNEQSTLDVPDVVVRVNGSKCILANKGTSLLVLATKNNINLNKILEFNELAEDGILGKEQFVYLQKKSKTGDRDFYITQQGETMYDVAQKNGIQLQYLLDYNADKKDKQLVAGTKLFLKPVAKKEVIKNIHIVAAKESVYAISKKYNITVTQLREWNNLQTDDLKIGQQLKISENK